MKKEHPSDLFGPEDSWPGAKKALDTHFRRKKITYWMLAASFAGLMILGSFWLNQTYFKSSEPSQKVTAHKPASDQEPKQVSANSSSDESVIQNINANQASPANTTPTVGSNTNPNELPKEKIVPTSVSSEKKSVKRVSASKRSQPIPSSTPAIGSVVNNEREFEKAKTSATSDEKTVSFVQEHNSATSTEESNSSKQNTFKSSSNTENTESVVRTIISEPLTFLTPLKNKSFSERTLQSKLIESNGDPLKEPKTHASTQWTASVYGGTHYIWKEIEAAPGPWLNRRNNEEKGVLLPSLGGSLSASKKNVSLSVGIEYSSWGEKVNYSPVSLQSQLIQIGNWQTYMYTITDTDTAYIQGNQYFLQNQIQRTDSNYISVTDTVVKEAYDASVAAANGTNHFWYVEIPVELSLKHSFGKFGLGASAGVAPAWLVSKKGNYLKQDLKGAESVSEAGSYNSMIVNGRVSVDFYYQFFPRLNVVIRPQLRGNLQSVFDSNSSLEQKYRGAGILFGINYSLK